MQLGALYVDFNSYFASVEQQEVPQLRGKPVGVLPVMAETTCCIAASYEAKKYGVKTGTKVHEARKLCPEMIFVQARPELYVRYHHKLIDIVESCTHVEKVLSIDEMVCKLTGSQQIYENALALAQKIKSALRQQAGEYIRSSIGIAPNTFLAKLASNMQKPDGCVVLQAHDLPEKLYQLPIRALSGIGSKMEQRLQDFKIDSMQALYSANRQQLRAAWGSIEGEVMYEKLRGFEPTERKNPRRSLGHSHVLPPDLRNPEASIAVLHRLLQKACMRLRSYQLQATTVQVHIRFINRESWANESAIAPTDDTLILTQALEQIWKTYPANRFIPLKIGVVLSGLVEEGVRALDLFSPQFHAPQLPAKSKSSLNKALDKLNMRYGKNTVYFGGAHNAIGDAPMRIAFNHIPDLAIEDDGVGTRKQ
ncbi:DNA polymerase Y family protein [Methyloradius palustris]|uniref:DNA polymerase IV n=1 Tax=Methyloradius palustris TaxID=2778876 RepID=A0A8D5G9Q9_9PROT|nr:DNA polymerase [Methyloradius palustris]BCM25702.1 DNA polymerase IV [Methyloradius palustris]